MRLFTVQLAQWRHCKALGIELLDTTVRTGTSVFAPTWELVSGVKSGAITEAEYTEGYIALMRQSYSQHQEYWLSVLRKEELAIACFCPAGNFCHRRILIELLSAVAAKHGIPFQYMGEITASGVVLH